MMSNFGFQRLLQQAKQHPAASLAVAGGNDPVVIQAVTKALQQNLVSHVTLTGDVSEMTKHIPAELRPSVDLIRAEDAASCAQLAVQAVRSGDGDILMKGHVDSTSYLRAIVDRKTGIRKASVLSNITVAAMPSYPKWLAATDNGIVPAPDLEQKRDIIRNTKPLFNGLGLDTVKVAALAATEKVSDRLPATVDAAALAQESARGALAGFVVDGPFGYDVAVSQAAAASKGLAASPVAGQADLLLFPTIDAANAVAKAWKFHGQAETGSLVLGATVPVLLNSRSDNADRRLNAIALALAATSGKAAGA